MKNLKLGLVLSMAILAISTAKSQTNYFSYSNPITQGIDPNGLRDCQILRDGDWWYMTGTSFPHWEREEVNGQLNPGVVLYRSKDLLNWEHRGFIVKRGESDKWYHRRFWAPEIQVINGKYYALFNASNPELGYKGQHTGYAVADNIEGPYKIVTESEPLCSGNDLTFFQDDDKSVWCFWNQGREFGIGFAKVDLEKGTLISDPKSAIKPGKVKFEYDTNGKPIKVKNNTGSLIDKVDQYYEWDSSGIEGAYVIKDGDTYYLFYSSWSRGYEIGYATAQNITGPWTKADNNPFYGAQSESACVKNGLTYTPNPECIFNQVGHNEIFVGPDGRYWLSCHGIAPGKNPMLVIDPLEIKDGKVSSVGPTSSPQTITW